MHLFLTVPSLDTPIGSTTTGKFSQLLTRLAQLDLAVFLISADLPFAQTRWQATEGIENITMLSDYRERDFARNRGILIQELGLLAGAVYVIDRTETVTYREVVSELTAEPNYEAAIAALT